MTLYRNLVRSEGWVRLVEIANQQIINRNNLLKEPAKGLDGAFANEFQKGEVAGIDLFVRLPSIQVLVLEQDIRELLEQNEGEG